MASEEGRHMGSSTSGNISADIQPPGEAGHRTLDENRKVSRKRIWVPHVDSELRGLQIRVDAAAAKRPDRADQIVVQGVHALITRAERAAHRKDPVPGRIFNWWQGTLVEAAYRNLHAARAHIVELYDADELDAELPSAVARVHSTLSRDDPRRVSQADLRKMHLERRRAWVRRLIEDGYDASDHKHAQLRSFRNALLMAAAVVTILISVTILVVSQNPTVLPLCFPADDATGGSTEVTAVFNCPTRQRTSSATGGDILIVALLGLLGGALAASIAIRNLRGTSGAYDVPVALAWLKVPLGAFTAVLGIVAVRGGFIPGLSRLDSQDQILAYALLFGFAQQLFTGVLDKRVQTLVESIPTKDSQAETASARTD